VISITVDALFLFIAVVGVACIAYIRALHDVEPKP